MVRQPPAQPGSANTQAQMLCKLFASASADDWQTAPASDSLYCTSRHHRTAALTGAFNAQVAEAQEAAREAKELVQEQNALANEIRRQAEAAKGEAGPLLRQVEQNEQQVRMTIGWRCTLGLPDTSLDTELWYWCAALYESPRAPDRATGRASSEESICLIPIIVSIARVPYSQC